MLLPVNQAVCNRRGTSPFWLNPESKMIGNTICYESSNQQCVNVIKRANRYTSPNSNTLELVSNEKRRKQIITYVTNVLSQDAEYVSSRYEGSPYKVSNHKIYKYD